MKPVLEVADIFRRHGHAYRQTRGDHMGRVERRIMAAIVACRTAALGGHVEQCIDCGKMRISYNSCRNRHCPKCQNLARAKWLEARKTELLPVPYFHVVFTLPAVLADIAFQNKALVYNLLMRTAADALRTMAADARHLGAEIGLIAVLHTWGQTLQHHPHVHCIVPGGGVCPDGKRWIASRADFFLDVQELSALFRKLFLHQISTAFTNGCLKFFGVLAKLADPGTFAQQMAALSAANWVVYAKRPCGGPEQVLAYLGRYTHRVAIANSRLIKLEEGNVSFSWKDYRQDAITKTMTLSAGEFIRRFLLHALPDGFQRIRHYGLLAHGHCAAKLALCRRLLATPPPPPPPSSARDYRERYRELTGHDLSVCPHCSGRMLRIRTDPPLRAHQHAPAWCDTS